MTNEEKIALVRVLGAWDTDEEDFSNEVLLAYLNVAGRKILDRAYPFDSKSTSVPERYETLQCEIAVYLLNKRGAEGETSHSETGISRSYENADIPPSMLSAVTPFVGVL